MASKSVTLMINSTFYDMLGEYVYFIRDVFPRLKEICAHHEIDLEYKDVAFSVPEEDFNPGIILQDFRYIDSDRTFFICFRGQKMGWIPTPEDLDGLTVHEYPEIIDYIGSISITELAVMHALIPFDKCIDGKLEKLPPTKHSLFYFRNNDYLSQLNRTQKEYYANDSDSENMEVLDIEIAKAKDIIYEIKRDYDKHEDIGCHILIKHYDARWDKSLDIDDVLVEYADEYCNFTDDVHEYFLGIHRQYLCEDTSGCLGGFEYEGRPLSEVMIEDILGELKLEFPENFE